MSKKLAELLGALDKKKSQLDAERRLSLALVKNLEAWFDVL